MQNLKMSFICITMKIYFDINSFTLSLTLKQRLEATRKWLIDFDTWQLDITFYYMAESAVFAMRLVNFRSVTCYTDHNFKENAHFGAVNLFTSGKKVEIKLQDVYQP